METALPAPAGQPPFTPGSIIGRTFSIWAANIVAFSAVSLVLHAPNLVLSLVTGPAPVGVPFSPGFAALGIVNAVVSGILSLAATGALAYGVLQSFNGTPRGVGDLLGFGVRRIWPVLVVTLDVGFRVFLWSLLLIVPGVMAACRLFIAVPARVAEPALRSHDAVARSEVLTKGHRSSIFVVILVFWVVGVGTDMLVSVLGIRAVLPFAVATTVTWVVGAVVNSLWTTAAGVAYHDLRVEKEGVDTAQLAAVFD